MSRNRGDNPTGLFPAREQHFSAPTAVSGVAFNGGATPAVICLTGTSNDEIASRPHGFILTDHPGRAVEWLSMMGYKVSGRTVERTIFSANGLSDKPRHQSYIRSFRDAHINSGRRGTNKPGIIMGMSELTDRPVYDFFGGDPENLALELATIAYDYVEWCRETDFPVANGRGAQASQFLMDSRFGWFPRRIIPLRHCRIAQENLPAVYARAFEPAGPTDGFVREVDQKSAHHYSAILNGTANSSTLVAYGLGSDSLICSPGSEKWERLVKSYGMHKLLLKVDHAEVNRRIKFPFLETLSDQPFVQAWVWSSEINAVINEPGVEIVGALATLSSRRSNPGLSNFAKFSMREIDRNRGTTRMTWLKPLLVSAYGVLAIPPKEGAAWTTIPSKNTHNARSVPWIVEGREVQLYVYAKRKIPSPRFANPFDTGIIQAATRAETIAMARKLEVLNDGRVVMCMGDSCLFSSKDKGQLLIFAEDEYAASMGDPLGALSEAGHEWRVKQELTNFEILASNSYRSDQTEKRPGIPRGRRGLVPKKSSRRHL